MRYKYGNFKRSQIALTKKKIKKEIFFLLLCADPKTKQIYSHINLSDAFNGLLYKLDGLNNVMGFPQELVDIVSLLEEALIKWNEPVFDFSVYRRLILNAGALTDKIKEED